MSAARNFIGYESVSNAPANLTSKQRPTSLTFGTTVRVEDGPFKGNVFRYLGANRTDARGIDLYNANYEASDLWEQTNLVDTPAGVRALVLDSRITTNGALNVDAQSTADIDSTVVSVTVGISGGAQVGVAVGVGGAFSVNRTKNNVQAIIDGAPSTEIRASQIHVGADNAASIKSDTAGASVAAAFGQIAGVSVAFGLALSRNEIADNVLATISNADSLVTQSGDVDVQAHSRETIESLALSIVIAPAFGSGIAGVAVAGAGASAWNVDLSQTNATIYNSNVTSAANVILRADNVSRLTSTIVTTSLSVAVGKAVAVGMAIGVADARNLIGYTTTDVRQGTPVQAYVQDSSIHSAGVLKAEAFSDATITSEVGAGAAAIAVGASLISGSVSLAGAGASSLNRIAYNTRALISGDGNGIEVQDIILTAVDASRVRAETGSVAVTGNLALVGASISIGTSIAKNLLNNIVESLIVNADQVRTTIGHVTLSAEENAVVRSKAFAAAAAISVSIFGAAIGVAPLVSSNQMSNSVRAGIESSTVTAGTAASSTGNVSAVANDRSNIDSSIQAITATVGVVSLGISLSSVTNVIDGAVSAFAARSNVTSLGAGNILLSSTSTPTITTKNTVGAVSIGLGAAVAGGSAESIIANTVHSYVDSASLTADGNEITVQANSTNTLSPETLGLTVGLIGISNQTSLAKIAGQTLTTFFGNSRVRSRGTVLDSRSSNTTTTGNLAARQVNAGLFTIGNITSTAEITRATNSTLASNASLDIGGTALKFVTNSISNADASASSVSAAAIAISTASINATANPTTRSAAEPGSTIRSSGGPVFFESRGETQAHSNVKAFGIGIILNVSSSNSTATATPTTISEVKGDISGDSSTTAPAAVYVIATSDTNVESRFSGDGGGLISVSSGSANANSIPQTIAAVGFQGTIRAGSIQMSSIALSEADASARSSSGGVVNVSGLNSRAQSTPYIASEVGGYATLSADTIRITSQNPDSVYGVNPETAIFNDGYTTASSASSSGGFVDVGDANASAINSPTIFSRVLQGAKINGRDIQINTRGVVSASSSTLGKSGGVVTVGGVDSIVEANPNVRTLIDSGAKIQSTGSVVIQTRMDSSLFSDSLANRKGLIAIVNSNSTIRHYPQVVNEFYNSEITALGMLQVDAISQISAKTTTVADGGGLGVETQAGDWTTTVGDSRNQGVNIGGETTTLIGSGARLVGSYVVLSAQMQGLNATSDAKTVGTGLGSDSDAVANTNVVENTSVILEPDSSVDSWSTLQISAGHQMARVRSHANAEGQSAFGDSDATSITNLVSRSRVMAKRGSRVSAFQLLVNAQYDIYEYDRNAQRDGGIDFGSAREDGNYVADRRIFWAGDIVLSPHPQDVGFVIGEDGRVESAKNLQYRITNDGGYEVTDIGFSGSQSNPAVSFNTNFNPSLDGKVQTFSSLATADDFSQVFPNIIVAKTLRSVNIVNKSTLPLSLGPILGTTLANSPTVTLNGQWFNDRRTMFNVVQDVPNTTINIQSNGPLYVAGVSNPVGSTTIKAPSIGFGWIESHALELETPGNAGSSGSTIDIVHTSAGYGSLSIKAGGEFNSGIQGSTRVRPELNSPVVTVNITHFEIGRGNVVFRDAAQELSDGYLGNVIFRKDLGTQTTATGGLFRLEVANFTATVNSQFPVLSSTDAAQYNLDVLGRYSGSTAVRYYSTGLFNYMDQANTSVTVQQNVTMDLSQYRDLGATIENFLPGADQKWADINGDGLQDLLTFNNRRLTLLTRVAGTNSFRVAQVIEDPIHPIVSFAIADVDQDGDVDLAFQRESKTVIWKNVNGVFDSTNIIPLGPPYSWPAYENYFGWYGDLSFADLNGDGYQDLVDVGYNTVVHFLSPAGFIGSTVVIVSRRYSSVDIADFDQDGDADLLIGDSLDRGRLYLNDGRGGFTDTLLSLPSSFNGLLKFGDSDGDGDQDVLVVAIMSSVQQTRTIALFRNDSGNLNLTYSMQVAVSDVLWFDHDGDGDLDLLLHYFNPDRNVLMLNQGETQSPPTFISTSPRDLPIAAAPTSGWSVAQLTENGSADLFFAGTVNGQPFTRVFQNTGVRSAASVGVPTKLSGKAISGLGMLTWAAPRSTSASRSPYTYNVRIKRNGVVSELSTPSGKGAVTATSLRLYLEPNVQYAFSVQTVDSRGTKSAWSDESPVVTSTVIDVNKPGDSDDGDIANLATTLREAINFANARPETRYTINLQVDPGTVTNELRIRTGMTIQSQVPRTILGGSSNRIFNINDDTSSVINVELSNLILKNGLSDIGAAIYSTESLTGTDLRFENNRADGGMPFGVEAGNGGTLWLDVPKDGKVVFTNITIQGSRAGHYGGAVFIRNSGTVDFNGSNSISNSSAGWAGGALHVTNLETGRFTAADLKVNSAISETGTAGAFYVVNSGVADLSGFSSVNSAAYLVAAMYLNNAATGVATVSGVYTGHRNSFGYRSFDFLQSGALLLENAGQLLVKNVKVSDNSSEQVGAIVVSSNGGTVTLDRLLVTGNSSKEGSTGGLRIYNSGGTITLSNSLIEQNTGRPIEIFNGATATTVLEGNSVIGNTFGDLAAIYSENAGRLFVSQNTISQNTRTRTVDTETSASGAGISVVGGINSLTSIVGNTVALNKADASPNGSAVHLRAADAAAEFSVLGNLIGDNLIGVNQLPLRAPSDRTTLLGNWIGNNAGLLPLSIVSGGVVPVHLLALSSPARERGAEAAALPAYDQRGYGYARVVGRADAGAVEMQGVGSRTYVVSSLVDGVDGDVSPGQFSLAEAIQMANATPGKDVITFDSTISSGTIKYESKSQIYDYAMPRYASINGLVTPYHIVDSVSIQGPGAGLLTMQNSAGRVLNADNSNPGVHLDVELSGFRILNPKITSPENFALRDMVLVSDNQTSAAIEAKPASGANFRIERSFIEKSGIQAAGSGSVDIVNSTLVTTQNQPLSGQPAIRVTGSNLLNISNSTLVGYRVAGTSQVVDASIGGVDGIANVVSSIVPYAGAGSVFSDSLVSDGTRSGLSTTSTKGTLIIDQIPPAAPVLTSSVGLTNIAQPTLLGTAEGNSMLRVTVDPDSDPSTPNNYVQMIAAGAGPGGDWRYDLPRKFDVNGHHKATFSIVAIDAALNESPATVFSMEIDTTAPAAPVFDLPAVVNEQGASITGLAEPGSRVRMLSRLMDITVTANEYGEWNISLPTTPAGQDASYRDIQVTVTATDLAGNISNPEIRTYNVNSTTPPAPSITGVSFPNIWDMNDIPRPIFSGQAMPGSTIILTIDIDSDSVTNNSFEITTTTDARGDWSVRVPVEHALPNGFQYTANAVQVNAAGTASAASVNFSRYVMGDFPFVEIISPSKFNTLTPTIRWVQHDERQWLRQLLVPGDNYIIDLHLYPGYRMDYGERIGLETKSVHSQPISEEMRHFSGEQIVIQDGSEFEFRLAYNTGGYWPFFFSIDLTAPAAPTSSISDVFNTVTPTLSGTAEPLSTVEVLLDPDNTPGTRNSVPLTATTDAQGNWSLSVPASAGIKSGRRVGVQIKAKDAATNLSPITSDTFLIDAVAPDKPTVYLMNQVSTATPIIQGVAEPLSQVMVSIDPDNNPNTDNSVTLSQKASSTGLFSVTSPVLVDRNQVSVNVTATDLAGNVSAAWSQVVDVIVDDSSTPPEPKDHRVGASGGSTSDPTPTVYGIARPNSRVQVFIDPDRDDKTANTIILSTIAASDGTWSVTVGDSDALSVGSIAGLVTAFDDANGNLVGSFVANGGLDPQFTPNPIYGADVPVIGLQVDSPAIDRGSNDRNLQTDSRGTGYVRISGSAADIGAYETQPAIFTVTTSSAEVDGDFSIDDLSFQEAILLSNLNPGVDTIRFASNVTEVPVALTSASRVASYSSLLLSATPEVAITDSVRIDGRSDRGVVLTPLLQTGSWTTPDGTSVSRPAFILNDDRASSIFVTLFGITLKAPIVSSENLILDNVSLSADEQSSDPYYLVSTGG